MTALWSAVPAAAGSLSTGPRLPVSVLSEFAGSVPLGIGVHVGFALAILWLAVRWARDVVDPAAADPGSAERPLDRDRRAP